MRWQLAWPGRPIPLIAGLLGEANAPGGIMLPEFYNQLGAMHGTIMVFLGIVPLGFAAFGNYVTPLQIGAVDMAFPRVNMASFWVFFIGGSLMFGSFFLPSGAAQVGWTNYSPLATTAQLMRSQIRYQVFQDEANYNLSVATDRELVELIYRAAQGEELDGADRAQNFIRLIAYFRIQENIHYQYRQGLFDQQEYENIKLAQKGFVGVGAETANVWCVIRRGTSKEFRDDMDQAFVGLDCENQQQPGT